MEKYTSATGAVVARIRVPTLSVSTGTVVYMYYGNISATISLENEHGVWDSNFVLVYEMDDTIAGVSNEVDDDTANHNRGRGYKDTAGGTYPT
jgi:hypothetical protein